MEYLTREERERLERNNARLQIEEDLKKSREKEMEDLVDRIELIKDTIVFPSPGAIVGRFVEEITGTPVEILLLKEGVGTMIKRDIGRKGLKRFGESFFNQEKRGKVESLKGLGLFKDYKPNMSIMLVLLIGGGLMLLKYAKNRSDKRRS